MKVQSKNKTAYIPKNWETVNCPFCDANKPTVYERFGSELQYTYVKCGNCGLIYSSPRPVYDQHFIDAAYALYYQYAENLQISDLDHVKESSYKMFQKEVAHIVQYDKKRTGVLDIGSGMGTFLLAAKEYYTDNLAGLDVSEKMAAFVEKMVGVKVHLKQFTEFIPERKFSLIHMSHVMEHIPNPNEWLQHAKKVLIDDGILVINVPNKMGFGYRLHHFFYKSGLKRQYSTSWNDPSRTPDHLFEPTVRSMKYLLDKNGYEVLEHYSYSRRDPVSNRNIFTKLMHRYLKRGTNLAFITRPR